MDWTVSLVPVRHFTEVDEQGEHNFGRPHADKDLRHKLDSSEN